MFVFVLFSFVLFLFYCVLFCFVVLFLYCFSLFYVLVLRFYLFILFFYFCEAISFYASLLYGTMYGLYCDWLWQFGGSDTWSHRVNIFDLRFLYV